VFMNLNEFAANKKVVRQTAADYLSKGMFPYLKVGNNYYIPDTSEYMVDLMGHRDSLRKSGIGGLDCSVISLVNHKGGVGKTIASVNVAASLAFFGNRVLLIDTDPQANASKVGGLKKANDGFKDKNLLQLLNNLDRFDPESNELKMAVEDAIVSVDVISGICHGDGKLDLLPNSIEMIDMVEPLIFKANSANFLDILIEPIKSKYDFIIIDCGPNLDVLWKQSVVASDELIVATKLEDDSVDGLIGVIRKTYKLNTIYRDRKKRNIDILGAIVTEEKRNAKFAKTQEPELIKILDNELIYNDEPGILFSPYISSSVKAAELQEGSRIALVDIPTSNMTDEYLRLSASIAYYVYSKKGV